MADATADALATTTLAATREAVAHHLRSHPALAARLGVADGSEVDDELLAHVRALTSMDFVLRVGIDVEPAPTSLAVDADAAWPSVSRRSLEDDGMTACQVATRDAYSRSEAI